MKKSTAEKICVLNRVLGEVGPITLRNAQAKQQHPNDYPFWEASRSQLGVHMTTQFRMLEDGYGVTFTVATLNGADLSEVKRAAQQLKELNHDIKREKIYFVTAETSDILKELLKLP